MQLSLNRWPPLVSHFACLILGITLTNFARPNNVENPFRPGRAVVSIPDHVAGAKNMTAIDIGRKIFFARKEEDHSLCLIKSSHAEIMQTEPFLVVGVTLKNIPSFAEILNRKNQGRIVLMNQLELTLPDCTERYQIRYGSGN